MPPQQTERFIATMHRLFRRHVNDEYWGPIYGPGGPHMRAGEQIEPDPMPWRELGVAYRFASMADALELATEGAGVALLKRFAEEPDSPCGTRPPGWPRPHKGKGDEPWLDRAILGAALVFVAEGVGNEALADVTREVGESMIG